MRSSTLKKAVQQTIAANAFKPPPPPSSPPPALSEGEKRKLKMDERMRSREKKASVEKTKRHLQKTCFELDGGHRTPPPSTPAPSLSPAAPSPAAAQHKESSPAPLLQQAQHKPSSVSRSMDELVNRRSSANASAGDEMNWGPREVMRFLERACEGERTLLSYVRWFGYHRITGGQLDKLTTEDLTRIMTNLDEELPPDDLTREPRIGDVLNFKHVLERALGRKNLDEAIDGATRTLHEVQMMMSVKNVFDVDIAAQTFRCELDFELRWEIDDFSDLKLSELSSPDWIPNNYPKIEVLGEVSALMERTRVFRPLRFKNR